MLLNILPDTKELYIKVKNLVKSLNYLDHQSQGVSCINDKTTTNKMENSWRPFITFSRANKYSKDLHISPL